MRNIIYIAVVLLASFSLFRCGGAASSSAKDMTDTLYAPVYAKGYCLYKAGNNTVLSIIDPWQGAEGVRMDVLLLKEGEKAPDSFEGQIVNIPLKNVVCFSSTHIAFAEELGCVDAVKAVSGARYITNSTVRSKYESGDVIDVGHDSNTNYEAIAALKPDLVMIYGVAGENSAMTRKFRELGIKYVYIGDYVEQAPLGKAEWLVAFGELFGQRELAEDKFTEIEKRYLTLKNEVVEAENRQQKMSSSGRIFRPKVMLNAPYRDTWFVPGDRSYMVQLIRDSGGEYVCQGVDSEVSRPISGESAFVYANQSDIWLNPGQANSLQEIKILNPKFANISVVENGRVYNCNKRSTAEGGSDFWESGAVRPDIVLSDMVKIMNPHMIDPEVLDRDFYYFKKIE